jgi:hypothetical protein
MPKYLDFDATKDFRDKMLNRTLNPIYGKSPSPKTFTSKNYSVQSLGDSPNLLLPQVDGNRTNDLLEHLTLLICSLNKNTFLELFNI